MKKLFFIALCFISLSASNIEYSVYRIDAWYVSDELGRDWHNGHMASFPITSEALADLELEDGQTVYLRTAETYIIGEYDITAEGISFDSFGGSEDKAILRGSIDISGLTWTDEGGGVYSTPQETEPNDIWFSGRVGKITETVRIDIDARPSTTTIDVDPADLSGLDVVGAYAVVSFTFRNSHRVLVTDYNESTGLITVNSEIPTADNLKLTLYNKFDYFSGNNEWAWENGELRVKVSADPSTLDIRMAEYDYCFKTTANTTFRNLEFKEYHQFAIWSDGGTIDVTDCDFHDIRDTGVMLQRGVDGAVVSSNTFRRIGNVGIWSRPCSNSEFNSNIIDSVGVLGNYPWQTWFDGATPSPYRHHNGVGILFGSADALDLTISGTNNQFSDNQISNTAYNGMTVSTSSNNKILRNHVYDFAWRFNDTGGIYTYHFHGASQTTQRNTEIANNTVHDNRGTGNIQIGIYLDEWTEAAYVHDNTVYNCKWAMLVNFETSDHTIEDNIIFDFEEYGVVYNLRANSTLFPLIENIQFNGNIISTDKSAARCMRFLVSQGSSPNWNPYNGGGADGNYYINPANSDIANGTNDGDMTLAEMQAAYGTDANSVYRDNTYESLVNATASPVSGPLPADAYVTFVAASSQRISCGSTADMQFERTDPFSIYLKFRADEVSAGQILLANFDASNHGYTVQLAADGRILIELRNTASTNRMQKFTVDDFDDGNWHEVLITKPADFTTTSIWVDGTKQEIGTDNNNLTQTIVSTESLNLGARESATSFFDGDMDEVAIWNVDNVGNESAIFASNDLTSLTIPPLHHLPIQNGDTDAEKFADTGTSSTKLNGTGVNDPVITADEFLDVDLNPITNYTIPAHYGLIYLNP